MDSVRVIVSFDMQKDLSQEEFAQIQNFVKASRDTPDCQQFELVRDQENPDRFSFVEKWRSNQAVDQHTKTTYFRNFVSFLATHVSNLQVQRLEQVL